MAPNRRQAIIWTNADLICWRIYAALGGDELTRPGAEMELFQGNNMAGDANENVKNCTM